MSDDETDDQPAPTWPRVIKLQYPIDYAGTPISELVFRRGKIGDMTGIKLRDSDLPTEDLLKIAARLCGQPTKALEMLDIDDAGEVVSIAMDFYKKYLAGKRR